MTSDENAEYSQYYTDLDAFIQENEVKFIKGERSLDEYDAYRQTLRDMGIDRCIALQQAALDRYNKR
jgi:putative aldouronate transport system substrate-binding protein